MGDSLRLFQRPSAMERLSGHSALAIGDKVVVYGGKTSATTLSGEVIALDISTREWNRVAVTGIIPRARAFHSAVAFESAMVVFGGLLAVGMDDIHYNMFNAIANADNLPANVRGLSGIERLKPPSELNPTTQRKLEPSSLYCLNLKGHASWSALSSLGAHPPTRCYHSATVFDGCMLITGGYSVHTTGQPRDEELQAVYSTFSLNLHTMVWREIVSPFSIPKRWGSSAILSGPYWILYGGIDIAGCCESSAISVFNIPKGEWKVLALGDDKIPSVQPRAMHTAVRWGDRFVMFGGAFDLGAEPTNQLCHFDLLSGALSQIPRLSDAIPCARYGHSAVVIGSDMVVFGGSTSSGVLLGDVWSMSLTSGEWRQWGTQWSCVAIDNVFNQPAGSLAPCREPTAGRGTIATQSESTPMEVLESLRAHAALEEKRRVRDEMLAGRAAEARRRVLAVDEGDFHLGAPSPSPVRLDVDLRAKRFQDLTSLQTSTGDDGHVWSHWQTELDALHRENSRWQNVSEVETSAVTGEFFSRHDQMLSPHARKAILNCQTPTALSPKQHLYVSPSLAKLGLRDVPQQRY